MLLNVPVPGFLGTATKPHAVVVIVWASTFPNVLKESAAATKPPTASSAPSLRIPFTPGTILTSPPDSKTILAPPYSFANIMTSPSGVNCIPLDPATLCILIVSVPTILVFVLIAASVPKSPTPVRSCGEADKSGSFE